MAGIMANPKMRQLIVIGLIVALILVMFVALVLSSSTEEQEIRTLKQEEFDVAPVTREIPMADSDYIEIDGTKYPHPDKLFDIEEIWIYGTNETNPDSDYDGMEDGWEAHFGKIDLLTGLLTLDPMRFDAFENPDGDGWDADHNGKLEGDEHLNNLEEYCGGSFDWGPFAGHNLDPQGNYEDYLYYRSENDKEKMEEAWNIYYNQTKYIQYHGGFHLVDYPYNELIIEKLDEYEIMETQDYKSYDPGMDTDLTTDPSNSDSDFDGMSDGFEIFFRKKCEYITRTYLPTYNDTLDPLDPTDAEKNIDIKKTEDTIKGISDLQYITKMDNLTNLQEFENGTDPTMYDSDDDSYFDQLTGRILEMPDHYELKDRSPMRRRVGNEWVVTSTVDWDHDGIIDTNTNPNSKDTDGDFMGDGWEENFGLNPCNASDRFLDNDNDGLPNYLEFAYPNASNVWFRTMPNDRDTDDDGIPDGWEAYNTRLIKKDVKAGYNADVADGLADGIAHSFTVNPMIPDSDLDLDGIWYDELGDGLDEEVYHKEGDNLTNLLEYSNAINPNSPDTDGDGLTDGEEVGYYFCLSSLKTITWWKCDNEDCPLFGEKIPDRYCSKCDSISHTTEECEIDRVVLQGGFYGKLLAGRWITDPNVAERYFTNASNPNSDGDFSAGAVVNESRYLDDWEEINGMEHIAADYIDNDGDGEIGSPMKWIDYNKNGIPESDEVSDYALASGQTDETVGGVFGAIADGVDNDKDGFTDEGIDEDDEGVRFTPTNASYYDTDHDGLGDVDEIYGIWTGSEYDPNEPTSGYGTVFPDPGAEDTDEDLLDDFLEINTLGIYKPYISNPLVQDSDGDGLTDGREWDIDFWPLEDHNNKNNYDANGDGTTDEFDNGLLVNGILINNDMDRTSPRHKDTDFDNLPDGWEYEKGSTRLRKFIKWHDKELDTNWEKKILTEHGGFKGGLAPMDIWIINPVDQFDKDLDPDGDGLSNWEEYTLDTDPLNWDSDGDGLPDGWEITFREFDIGYNKYNLDPSDGDTIKNDAYDDEDGDGNSNPIEEILDFRDNDGDGEKVPGAADGIDNDGDGFIDECDEVSYINWIDDDGDGLVDEGIDEEHDLNDANEDYDWDGVWYTIAWVDDDGDGEYDEDPMDDDGDGLINEDPADGIDNDGDDLIDEDTGGIEDDNDGDGSIDEDSKNYYHPFSNLMEYQLGVDIDNDGMNENTTWPNEPDTDDDGMADGWEIWYTDYIYNTSDPGIYQDNDTLPRGWEELFNGSLVIFTTDYIPRGLSDPGEANKFVGKFDPKNPDSNNNGIPDNEENYDADEWTDPHNPHPEEAVAKPCNNSAEYSGHSDPTYSFSTPKVEFRSLCPETTEDETNSGTSSSSVYEELSDNEALMAENTMDSEQMKKEEILELEDTTSESMLAVYED